MRRATKQTVSCKHPYEHKTWTNPRSVFQVLAGNLYYQNRKTPTIQVSATTILIVCSFYLQVSEHFE